jgi:type VI secretion system protein ImpL
VDKCLASLQQIAQQLNAGGVANTTGTALNQGGAVDLAAGLQLCAASLPAALGGLMKQVSAASQAAAVAQASGQLGDRLSEQVGADCKEVVTSGYPFISSSANDVPLGDFGRVFGVGGKLDGFFHDNLASLVKMDEGTWRWQTVSNISLSMPPTVLPAFQRAARVRDAFFEQGGQQPHIRFTLTADSLDSDVKRFVLEIDGQQFVYQHDPPAPWVASWPGPAPGLATMRFEDRNGGGPTDSHQGPWGWFHILDAAQIERVSSTRYLVSFHFGGKTARVVLDADSLHNPFERGLLGGFKCPGRS